MTTTTDMTLIRDNYRIDWCYLDEGLDGYYNEDDPNDQALLRFDVYELINGEWEPMDDASYCTMMPVGTDPKIMHRGLEVIHEEVSRYASAGYSLKKACESLSWMNPDWFAKEGN